MDTQTPAPMGEAREHVGTERGSFGHFPYDPVPYALRAIHEAGNDLHDAVRHMTNQSARAELRRQLKHEIARLEAIQVACIE